MLYANEAGRGPVRLGIIGCGIIGRQHLTGARAVPQSVEVVAVADLSADAVAAARHAFSIERGYTDALQLLDDPVVEAVVLALPTGIRGAIAQAAFARGKHVLLEKPAASTPEELEELVRARGELVAASCSARFRTTRIAQEACAIIASGRLGTVREIRVRGHQAAPARPEPLPPAWRLSRRQNGGGILWNWGPYDLDFVLGLFGWRLAAQTVFGQTWTIADELTGWVAEGSDGETHGVALIRFSSGCVMTLDRGEYLPSPTQADCQIIGTRGSLSLDMLPGPDRRLVLFESDANGTAETLRLESDQVYADVPPALLRNFAGAVRGDIEPLTSLENALTIARITEAVRRSAETGSSVRLIEEA